MTAAIYNRLHNSSLGGSVVHHTQLARSLERILEEAQVSGELILTNRKLKDFPKTGTKHNLADTIIADLSRNRFCELPEEVTTFPFLETLLVYHNTIRSIPESVKQLTSLTYLDLRSNQLSTLPREICFLPLQVLLVSNNRLTALPDELGRMDRLTDLDASYNQLSALPARIGELRSLRSLSLRSNQLMYLPRELTCLNLVALDVSNNRIASLPLEIRQMSTLVEFDLENNPLTSPPASLCIRGLVHVFKYLEIQATKDEKGSRAGGNYDGYTTLRRAPRHNSNSNILESTRSAGRYHIESGYNTCDGFDKRRSHDVPSGVKTKLESPARRMPTTPPSFSTELLNSSSLTSSSSTIVDDSSISKSLHDSPKKINKTDSPQKQHSLCTLHQHINYAQSSSSSGSSPDQDDDLNDPHQGTNNSLGKADEKTNKNLGNIQTYREYKEALKQQRNLDISSVYKIKGQKTLYDMTEVSNALNTGNQSGADEIDVRYNGTSSNGSHPMPKSIMKNGTSMNAIVNGNGSPINGGSGDDSVAIPKKPVQKVIPSRNMELAAAKNDSNKSSGLTNGDCLGYVKPSSPLKSINGVAGGGSGISGGGILTNSKKYNGGLKSPVNSTTKLGSQKPHRTVTWNHDISPEKLSFTMRREFDRQREETELMTQLRSIIETRLKMTLPEDIASALTDGVILCHLANYVRPRSVASIHVPSPGVSKLTMARCRRNVDNFLEACRKIGVDEELICSCADVVPNRDDEEKQKLNINNNDDMQPLQQLQHDNSVQRISLPNAPAVLKTVAALIAMDSNPHHQSIRNLQQQRDFQLKLQRQQQREAESEEFHQNNHDRYYYQNDIELNENHHQTKQQQLNNYQATIDNDYQLEQQQSTATITKEQMQQQQHQLKYETNNINQDTIEYRNSLNIQNENYQYINCAYQNGENYDDDDDDDQNNLIRKNGYTSTNGVAHDNNDDHDNTVHIQYKSESELHDVDHDLHTSVSDSNDMKICYKQSSQQQQYQQSTGGNMVRNLLRHAKLKSFQKIKLNLKPSSTSASLTLHGNNPGSTSLASTLQTIVETECDVASSGAAGVGLYHVINEKTIDDQNVSTTTATNTDSSVNKYKLLELPKSDADDMQQEQSNGGATVLKRIEFFEHSKANTSTTTTQKTQKNCNKNNHNALAKMTVPATIIASNKTKGSIFSIYHVPNVDIDGKLSKDTSDLKKTDCKESSPLFVHDSYVLTIILSCVFIVTFVLLIFFPLPG